MRQPLQAASPYSSLSSVWGWGSYVECVRDADSDLLMESCTETGENETLTLFCVPILSGKARDVMEVL